MRNKDIVGELRKKRMKDIEEEYRKEKEGDKISKKPLGKSS